MSTNLAFASYTKEVEDWVFVDDSLTDAFVLVVKIDAPAVLLAQLEEDRIDLLAPKQARGTSWMRSKN